MKHTAIFILTLLSLAVVSAHADDISSDVLWSCKGADKGLYLVSTADRSSNTVTVTKVVKGVEDVKQDGTYEAASQLTSAFIRVTNGGLTVLLAGYEPSLHAMTGFVQLTAEQAKVGVTCPLK